MLQICHSVIFQVQSALFCIDGYNSHPRHEGLIASVGLGGNANDIKLVEGLVTSYIKKQSCIILLTVACESGFAFLVCLSIAIS